MPTNYRSLSWPKNAVLPNVDLVFPDKVNVIELKPQEVFGDELLTFLSSFDLKVNMVLGIRYPPNVMGRVHIDGVPNQLRWGVNYVCGPSDRHNIEWFKTKDSEAKGQNVLVDNLPSVRLLRSQLDLVESYRGDGPILFNATTPHCANNYSTETRLAFSLRFHSQLKTWDEVVTHFQPWITPEESA